MVRCTVPRSFYSGSCPESRTSTLPTAAGSAVGTERKGAMAKQACRHSWSMADVRYGFMVTERCFRCRDERSYFAEEHIPPKEEYREGEHFWDYLGSSQSVRFNLKCDKCGEKVRLDELLGLMTCSRCTADCNFNMIARICEEQKTWVYGALLYNREDARKPETAEKLAVLSRYFSDRIRTPGKKILVLPGWLVKDFDVCRCTVLEDVGMFQTEPEPSQS